MSRRGLAVVGVGLAFAGGLAAGSAVVRAAHAAGQAPFAGLETLARVLTTVEERYLEPMPLEGIVHAALRGLAGELDPWTVYLPPERWQRVKADTEAVATGIGARLERVRDRVVVARLVPDGPAALAGLVEGDTVLAVDGETLPADMQLTATALDGTVGSTVVLTVQRGSGPVPLTVVRDRYVDVPVWSERTADGVGWLRIDSFVRGTASQVDRELARLEAEGPLAGLILDVRDNGGGLLDEATPVIDRFVSEGSIVATVGRDEQELSRLDARPDDSDLLELPLVVLVDGDSASAAEVTAGALQALGRAQLVGTPTYGKGLVQREFLLPEGGALRLTVSRYVLANDRSITPEHPLQPDIVVERVHRPSPRLAKLRDALVAGTDDPTEQDARLAALFAVADEDESRQDPPALAGALDERAARDPQLRAALELLR